MGTSEENHLAWVQKDLSEPSRTVSWLAPFPYPPPADAPWSISNDLQRPLAGIVSRDTKTGPLGASFLPAPFFLFRGHIRQITLRGQREYSFRLYVRNFAAQCSLLVTTFFLGGVVEIKRVGIVIYFSGRKSSLPAPRRRRHIQ